MGGIFYPPLPDASIIPGTTLAPNIINSSLRTVGILTSPHMTTPVVDSGGLTVTAGGLTVSAGGFTNVGALSQSGGASNINTSGSNAINLGTSSYTGTITIGNASVTGLLIARKLTSYAGVAVAGWGVPAIYAQARVGAQTNTTVTLTSYANPAATGTFLVSCHIEVTAAATASMSVSCTYTDVNSNAVTLTMPLIKDGTAGLLLNGLIVATGTYSCPAVEITAKASTTITLLTAGTVTGITYTGDGAIIQIA